MPTKTLYYKKQVPLIFSFDEEELPLVESRGWYAKRNRDTNSYYVNAYSRKCTPHTIAFHRVIMSALPGQQVDHIDGNPMNNVKSNLRIVTSQQNACNKAQKNKWGKGVRQQKSGRFQGVIHAGRWPVCIGTFATQEQAQDAYDSIAAEWFGPFALTNRMLKERRR